MIQVKRWITITLCTAATCVGNNLSAQERPAVWDLESCINYAMEQNITIRQNKIAAESAYVDVKTSQAALFPNLSFSTSHNFANRPWPQGNNNSKKNTYNGNYGLNASWTVYNGGKNTKTIEQQKLNNRVSELNVEQSEDDIEISITQLYVQILYADESVKINQNTLEVSEAQVNRAKELLKAGYIAQSDYAQLEAQYSNDKYSLVNSQAALQNYKLQLKQLLELDGEEEMNLLLAEISNESVVTILPGKSDVYRTALSIRPEIEASKLNIEASDLGISIAKAGYMPSLSLTAGIGTGHSNNSGKDFTFNEQIKDSWSNSVGVTLSVPIFNNRQTKSTVQKARLQYESSKLNMMNEEKALYSTIESIWLDANTAQQKYVAASEKLRSSQTSYELVSEQFNVGMKNTVELLTEKNNLLSAQQEVIQAKYMAVLNIQLLRFYQGENITL
ncbi:TolC family protein [Bacteroides sp. 224]|uniref:TolC family protein n=1 Tax=Bacteroides sp. 224 TaxID=2302936 RepID=UPI0013D64D83|nr:TolC family protein [Bacteroides sp. 224]NDV66729.1 TolC family protein [Bacteroides sp. 224]